MTILKDMGVQQWRLRRSAEAIQADVETVVSKQPVADLQDTVALEQSSTKDRSTERRIWPSATKEAPSVVLQASSEPSADLKSNLQNGNGLDVAGESVNKESTRPSITPAPMPAGAESSSTAVKTVMPMPAPVSTLPPAPASLPDIENIDTQDDDDSLAEYYADQPIMPTNSQLSGLDWSGLQSLVDGWQHCPTCGDEKSLLGHGNINADWLFVSDAPSSAEIAQKSLFAGRSGALFEAMLGALGLERDDVYTTSLFKCIASDDMSLIPACDTILMRQIELLQPKVIVTFGEFTSQTLLKANAGLDVLRTQDQKCINTKVTVVPTFTPVQMLDDASLKSKVWTDLKKAVAIVDMPS